MIDGTPFTSANAQRLMWIGWLLLGIQIAKPIAEGLAAGWILSMIKIQSPSISPGGHLNWSGILVALFILILSAIFRRGVELEKEHSLTV
jgi:membrane protein implicated in regulation of membrane protease activity